ncbi:MAG: cysteine desulfurase [Acidobacteriota bacterium]|nr:cysteine desulfurase [Acidobacteriota bacterium]
MQHYYFDHNATTPVAPEVLRDLTATLVQVSGNASSIHHFGQAAKQRLEAARRDIAARIGCDPREIVFTSGGTESDNLAIFGIARRALTGSAGKARKHIVTSTIEHPAVLNACAQLEREGAEVTALPVGEDGIVALSELKKVLRPSTALVTIMHANNETGALQPVREIAALAHSCGAVFHSDGVQVAGRLPVNVRELGVDLYSLSGHKFGAPKGIGALFVRKGIPLEPTTFGGHHERDRRAGTENVPGAAALGRAAELGIDWTGIAALRDRLERGILARIEGAQVNGSVEMRLPNTSNIRFDGIEGEAVVIALDLRGYAVSSGSACSSGAVEPSHVLLAMGLRPEEARSSVRFSLGPGNTEKEVDGLIEAVEASVAHLRHIAPGSAKPVTQAVKHV